MYTCYDYLIFILYDISMIYELLLIVECSRTMNVLETCLRGQNIDCMAVHDCTIQVAYKICLCSSCSFTIFIIIIIKYIFKTQLFIRPVLNQLSYLANKSKKQIKKE